MNIADWTDAEVTTLAAIIVAAKIAGDSSLDHLDQDGRKRVMNAMVTLNAKANAAESIKWMVMSILEAAHEAVKRDIHQTFVVID